MRAFLIAAFGCMTGGFAAFGQDGPAKPRNPEQMYLIAHTTLDDEKTAMVSGVLPLLEASANQGHPGAVLLLLDVYEGHRKGLAAKPEAARELARRVAVGELELKPEFKGSDAAFLECMYRYALFCERNKDGKQAFKWMYKTAQAGVAKARAELARYVMQGVGSRRNPRLALKLLLNLKNYKPDTPNVFFYLGYLHQRGMGRNHVDLKKAAKYYEAGNKYNDARAINNLAGMYEQGSGKPRDLAMALKLYKKAAALGNKDASANMQRLAYVKAEEEDAASISQKISRAALRVIHAMPLSGSVRQRLSAPFLTSDEASSSHSL